MSKSKPGKPEPSRTPITVDHVVIPCDPGCPFETTNAALEAAVPRLATGFMSLIRSDPTATMAKLRALPPLSILNSRHFGTFIAVSGVQAKVIQYDIGNPLTAASMAQVELGVLLYAPIRVLLREGREGVAFEYDRPTSTMGRFGPPVHGVAEKLDHDLYTVLMKAAGWDKCDEPNKTKL